MHSGSRQRLLLPSVASTMTMTSLPSSLDAGMMAVPRMGVGRSAMMVGSVMALVMRVVRLAWLIRRLNRLALPHGECRVRLEVVPEALAAHHDDDEDGGAPLGRACRELEVGALDRPLGDVRHELVAGGRVRDNRFAMLAVGVAVSVVHLGRVLAPMRSMGPVSPMASVTTMNAADAP